MTQQQLLSVFRQKLIGETWQSIDQVDWRYDAKARASILKISGKGKIDWENESDGTKSLALPGGGFSPPDRRARSPDQDQEAPYFNKPSYSCHVTTVRVPTTTKPGQWSSKDGFDTSIFGRNYYRSFDMRDGSIRMVRGSRIEKLEIDAAAAKRDNERIASFDNSMGYIFYSPSARYTPISNSIAVPTTFDFDWTANDAPCLAPDIMAAIKKQALQ